MVQSVKETTVEYSMPALQQSRRKENGRSRIHTKTNYS